MELIHGDCLEEMKKIPDRSIDLILCDLPYGTTKCHWDVVIPFESLWEQYNRIRKRNTPIILFGTQPFTTTLIASNMKMFKHEIIWHKSKSGSAFTAKFRPICKHENIIVFGKGKIMYNPQLIDGEPYYRKRKENTGNKPNNHALGVTSESETINTGFRYPSTIQFFQQKWRRQDQIHPTQKPIKLLEWLILSYSNEDDTILDNCMGSGSTGVACFNTNRNFIGIEKDDNYFEIAKNRIMAEHHKLNKINKDEIL